MPQDLDTLCYIQEQTSFTEDYKDFGYQVHDRGNRFFITFNAILQSFGIKNRNGREYDAKNIMERIENDDFIQDQLRHNSWIGEIDHPEPEMEGEKLTVQRLAKPNMKISSHYIRRPRLNGNLLEAPIQTDSSNESGMNMAIKIVDGKIIPCFSARVFGALKKNGVRFIVYVKKLITYDWVLYPSHREAEAKIRQDIITESTVPGVGNKSIEQASKYFGEKIITFKELAQMAANNSRETEYLCESFGLTIDDVVGVTESGNSIIIKENTNVYAQPITDKFVRSKTQNVLKDWLNS